MAIERLPDCGANHRETVLVQEVFEGRTIWQSNVEVFDLYGHDQAKICYGWLHPEGKSEGFMIVLQHPPIISPETAVRAPIVRD